MLGEHRPPWSKQIIILILPSVSINLIGNSLTICTNECRAQVVKGYSSKASGSTQSGHAKIIMVLCSFTHLRRSRSLPKFNQFFISPMGWAILYYVMYAIDMKILKSYVAIIYTVNLYRPQTLHNISSQSVHNLLSNVAWKQTNQCYQKYNLVCHGGK